MNEMTPLSLSLRMSKLWLLPFMIGLSASASAASINTFERAITFPEKAKVMPFLKVNFYANESDLNNLQTGLNKDQVGMLIGNTAFLPHLMTDRTWHYIFKFRELDKPDIVCQYQIQFDEHMKVSGSYFNKPACVFHLQPLPAGTVLETEAPVTAPVAVPLPASTQLSLPTNMLFGFNKSKLNDLPESLRDTLRTFAQQLKANIETLESITVIGHTDRLGNDEQNLKLSTARAETIKEFFVLQGVDADKVKTEGKGSTAPLNECTDTDRKKLIDCLAPNRRVDIEFKQK